MIEATNEKFPEKLGRDLLYYARNVSDCETPEEVLDDLDRISSKRLDLNVHMAARFPQRVLDWHSLIIGKTVFLQGQASKLWWQEWISHVPQNYPVGYALARMSMAPYAWTEASKGVQPFALDRLGYELALKYGAEDGFTCPVGGRWVLSFWSKHQVLHSLTQPARILLCAAASFAVMRLEQLVDLEPVHGRPRISLTQKEVTVLRLLAMGIPFKEAAQCLGLAQETIRTHLKKVQIKLGVRNRIHAVAEAMRQHLIP